MSENNKNNENSEKSKYSAQNKYNSQHSKQYGLRLNNVNDFDIIEVIEKQQSKNDFIKKALRFYIKNNDL